MNSTHPIFQAIQEIAAEDYHSNGDATPGDWRDCVIFGVESFVYGMDNGSEWTFVEVMDTCGAPLPTEVEWTVRGPGGGYPTEIRNVAEYARDEYDGDETEFLNVSYRHANASWGFSIELGRMVVEALERAALEVCTLPGPPAPVEVATETAPTHSIKLVKSIHSNSYAELWEVVVDDSYSAGSIERYQHERVTPTGYETVPGEFRWLAHVHSCVDCETPGIPDNASFHEARSIIVASIRVGIAAAEARDIANAREHANRLYELHNELANCAMLVPKSASVRVHLDSGGCWSDLADSDADDLSIRLASLSNEVWQVIEALKERR